MEETILNMHKSPRVISYYVPQVGRPKVEKDKFYDNLTQELGLKRPNEILVVALVTLTVILMNRQLDMKASMVSLVLVHIT